MTENHRVNVYSQFLTTLAQSPLWSWDSAPSLWAVMGEDPAIVTPIIGEVAGPEVLRYIAQQWQQNGAEVPVSGLFLVAEGWAVTLSGERDRSTDPAPQQIADTVGATETRSLLAVHRDGELLHVEHCRADDTVREVEAGAVMDSYADAMRLVGAAAWR